MAAYLGPHPFEPTDEQRRVVEMGAAFGIPQDQLARALDIDVKTLKKHFDKEMREGPLRLNQKVAQSLVFAATNWRTRAGTRRVIGRGKTRQVIIDPPSPTTAEASCMMFFLKCRAGWSERLVVDFNNEPKMVSDEPLSNEEFLARYQIKRLPPPGGNGHDAGHGGNGTGNGTTSPDDLA